MVLKYNFRKIGVGIMIIVIFSSFLLIFVVGNVFVKTTAQEYVEKMNWPAEILVVPNNSESVPYIEAHLGEIEGVKWYVYPGSGLEFQFINYNGKKFLIMLRWCNVEDPTFPNPKFLYEGRFFSSNYENAVIIDSATEKLLEYTGRFNGLGENGTKWAILGINMSIIGVISSPALYGNENHTLSATNVLYIYVPLYTYEMLFNISKQPQYVNVTPFGLGDFYVRVKAGYSIREVASRIRNRFPNATVLTVEDYRENIYSSIVIPSIRNSIIAFTTAGVIMVWEVRHRKDDIFLLKAIGWQRKDIVILFTLKNILLGIISSIAGICLMLLFYKIFLGFLNAYMVWFILSLTPLTMVFVITGTLTFSIPSLLVLYKASVEDILRK